MSERRKRQKIAKRKLVLAVIGALALAVLIFWGLFYITEVEVVGNTRYTAQEIQDMALTKLTDHNSILVSHFRSRIDLEEVPFMEYVDVEYLGRNRIRLHVTEKTPIGYISQDGYHYYFDKDGLVLEALAEDSDTASADAAGTDSTQETGQEAAADGTAVTGSDGTEGTSSSGTAADATETAAESTPAFRPALTDVPQIVGLDCGTITVDETLQVEDSSVFLTILALTKMLDRYEIPPDYVEFDTDRAMTLYYGTVRISLGTDTNLEEKMTRAAAILPKLAGESGVLHLEDFSEETVNIVFDRD